MQSVSGGGLWIGSLDHARVGLLMLRGGMWNGRRILSEEWVRACLMPAALNPNYGYLWWLNTDGTQAPAAPRSSFFAIGVGANVVCVDPEHDLVVMVRWIEKSRVPAFVELVLRAVGAAPQPAGSA